MSWLRFFVKTHNYLGLALSLFFLLLFGSGLVMMFIGYPRYYDPYRLPDLPALNGTDIAIDAPGAYQRSSLDGPVDSLQLNILQDRPVYRFGSSDGSYRMVFADNGETIASADAALAEKTARWFMDVNNVAGDLQPLGKMTDVDAWTTNPGVSGTSHWPFYKFVLNDAVGTQLYVSGETAEVIHKTTFKQRFWGILGPVIHYFYVPIELRQHPDSWFYVVVLISGVGSILCIFGLVIGLYFLRWKQLGQWLTQWLPVTTVAKTKAILPFKRWMYWHNFLGLVFGVITFTWIFSGMMSMNPMDWDGSSPTDTENARWTGGAIDPASLGTSFGDALAACAEQINVKEIRLQNLGGQRYFYCLESPEITRVVMDSAGASAGKMFSQWELLSHAGTLLPGSETTATDWLQNYDAYYQFGRPERIGDQVKRLPILRVKFNDAEQSWFYIDPYSGLLHSHFKTDSRLNRWLFDALHTLDFAWLHENHHTLWWIIMLLLMAGGTALSFTSLWLTVRWLRKQFLPVSEGRAAAIASEREGAELVYRSR